MEQGYKHFSHPHSLLMHHVPEGVEVSCSGCNSSGSGTVYVCWQCNFFLHEQCCKATRSLSHPSHPAHPLTLLPYPTYPSNSFYCNSCDVIGTGSSYSCADCDFDLHVQCAYSISGATGFKKTHRFSTRYYNPDQELVPPGWSGQNSTHNVAHSLPNPLGAVQNPYMNPPGRQNSFTTAPDPLTTQTGPSITIPMNSQYPISNAQYPSMAQTGPHVSQNPMTSAQPNPVTRTQDPSMPQSGPSASVPTIPQNPSTSVLYPSLSQYVASDSIPSKNQEPMPNMAQKIASENHVESAQMPLKDKGVKHFSHPHNLFIINIQKEEDEVDCAGCEENIDGKGYSCVEPNCDFHLHESCFNLKREIQHKSHPQHPLTLICLATYDNKNGKFTCNACFSDGTGFTYRCSICDYDLHVQCVSLPETVKREDHEHALKLFYSCPVQGEEYRVSCDVCHGVIQKDRWTYYCGSCDYGTHLGCVDCEECEKDTSVVDAEMQLKRLELQMELARQKAQIIAKMGSTTASMVN